MRYSISKMLSSGLLVVFGTLLVAVQAEEPRIGFNLPHLGLYSSRIIGGDDAERGEFPHQVSVQWAKDDNETAEALCGGSLIDRQWVLTSAHCIGTRLSFGKFIVKVGKLNIEVKEDTEQEFEVVQKIMHEKYDIDGLGYDIALLKLESPVTLNQFVKTINLPKFGGKPGEKSVLSGWGITLPFDNQLSAILQKVVLTIIDLDTCRESIENIEGPIWLPETNICTGSMKGTVSSCSGDSGSPLIRLNSTGAHEVIGITSWTVGPCAVTGAATVYIDVAQFVDWITTTINKNTHVLTSN